MLIVASIKDAVDVLLTVASWIDQQTRRLRCRWGLCVWSSTLCRWRSSSMHGAQLRRKIVFWPSLCMSDTLQTSSVDNEAQFVQREFIERNRFCRWSHYLQDAAKVDGWCPINEVLSVKQWKVKIAKPQGKTWTFSEEDTHSKWSSRLADSFGDAYGLLFSKEAHRVERISNHIKLKERWTFSLFIRYQGI